MSGARPSHRSWRFPRAGRQLISDVSEKSCYKSRRGGQREPRTASHGASRDSASEVLAAKAHVTNTWASLEPSLRLWRFFFFTLKATNSK